MDNARLARLLPYACGGGGSRRSCRRRLTRLPPAAARSRNATPARIRSGSGTALASEGPSHSIARRIRPCFGSSAFGAAGDADESVPDDAFCPLPLPEDVCGGVVGGVPLPLCLNWASIAARISSAAFEYVWTSRGRPWIASM